VLQAAAETGALVVMEEHSVLGGAGSAVTELVSCRRPVPVELVGFPDRHLESAPYATLVNRFGPSQIAILTATERAVRRKGSECWRQEIVTRGRRDTSQTGQYHR